MLDSKRIQKHQRCWSSLNNSSVSVPHRLFIYSTWTSSHSLFMWSTGRLKKSTKVLKQYWWLCGAARASSAEPFVFLLFRRCCCLAFDGSSTWFGTAIRAQKNLSLFFSSNTSALNTSRLGLMVCEWIERDGGSRITISPTLHRLITLQSNSHSKPKTSWKYGIA